MSLLDRLRLRENADRRAVQEWKDANGYDDLLDAYCQYARDLTTARARIAELEDWQRRAALLLETYQHPFCVRDPHTDPDIRQLLSEVIVDAVQDKREPKVRDDSQGR